MHDARLARTQLCHLNFARKHLRVNTCARAAPRQRVNRVTPANTAGLRALTPRLRLPHSRPPQLEGELENTGRALKAYTNLASCVDESAISTQGLLKFKCAVEINTVLDTGKPTATLPALAVKAGVQTGTLLNVDGTGAGAVSLTAGQASVVQLYT